MSNNDEYTPDFEVPSENDTSQVVSVQSEILDEVESSAGKSTEAESPPFTGDSRKTAGKSKKGEATSQDDDEDEEDEESDEDNTSSKSQNKELEEIEDIIRKLERLEKAQTLLEDALHLSDAEPDLPDISEKSERSYSTHKSSYRSDKFVSSSSHNASNKVQKPPVTLSSKSEGVNNSRVEDKDLSQALNTGIASIRQLMNKDLSSAPLNANTQSNQQPQRDADSPTPTNSQASRASKSSASPASKSTSSRKRPKMIDGSGDHSNKVKEQQQELSLENVTRLKNELARQEALIDAYQKENEKLYGRMKTIQDEIQAKEKEHDEEVNGLKTEIATLKLNRLIPVASGTNSPRLGSAHKGEMDRLNDELTAKSLMIVELRKEIALLRVEKENKPPGTKFNKPKSPALSLDKEKEYQDKMKALQKQVRTLQKILYSRENAPASAPSGSSASNLRGGSARHSLATRGRTASLGKFDVPKKSVSTSDINTAEEIKKLEEKLSKDRAEFHRKLAAKQNEVEDKDLEISRLNQQLANIPQGLADDETNAAESQILEQLQNKLLNQAEKIQTLNEQLSSYKNVEQERDVFQREVGFYESRLKELQRKLTRAETMNKPSFRTNSVTKDVGKPMNQEKEKEYQKQIQGLQKQVRTLQKILYSKDPKGAAAVPSTERVSRSASKEDLMGNVTSTRPKSMGPFKKPAPVDRTPAKPSFNVQVLESTFQQERMEFEKLLSQKQSQIEERDRQLRELKSKLSATIEENAWITHESSTEKATYDEFRTKLLTQNKIIDSLKSRLASYANAEAEKSLLKREIHHLEFRVQELQRKLSRAENLARPENEVLATLSEKVEDLHTRYYYRERQLDTLLDRLSMKTGQSFGSPRSMNSFVPSSYAMGSSGSHGNSNNNNSHDYPLNQGSARTMHHQHQLDLGDLSPSSTLHLIPHRDVPEI